MKKLILLTSTRPLHLIHATTLHLLKPPEALALSVRIAAVSLDHSPALRYPTLPHVRLRGVPSVPEQMPNLNHCRHRLAHRLHTPNAAVHWKVPVMLPSMEVYAGHMSFDLRIEIGMKWLMMTRTWLKRRRGGKFAGGCLRLVCSLSQEGSFLADLMLCTSSSPLPMMKIDRCFGRSHPVTTSTYLSCSPHHDFILWHSILIYLCLLNTEQSNDYS